MRGWRGLLTYSSACPLCAPLPSNTTFHRYQHIPQANNADGLVQVMSDGLDPLGAGIVPSAPDGQDGQSRLVSSAGRGEKKRAT